MCPRCWLLVVLLLESRAWGRGKAPECPGCPGGEVDAEEQTTRPEEDHSSDPCRNPSCHRAPEEHCDPACYRVAPAAPCDPACYRALGEPCGVYTPSCARGLRCIARAEETMPLQALLHGRGVCRNHTVAEQGENHYGKGGRPTLTPKRTEPQVISGRQDNPHQPSEDSETDIHHPLPDNKDKDQLPDAPHKKDNIKPGVHHPRLLSELVGPCRQHMERILQELHPSPFFRAKDMYIPNCDTRGFYRRKQCKSSKGQRRGRCWCVDKRGHKVSGSEDLEGNIHCPPGTK
ncbi:insulin-like growth factor-binding protein 6 [Ambystoma mexicanum]|uniref:insulin-like growth factor-binding protein 6 n=1 Tax=Ambystoma mexicanum TaxID=8296 RepID=UPI0037E77250